jgi:hypothetical protein
MNTAWRSAKVMLRNQAEESLGIDYAVVRESPSEYMIQLTTQLLERMHEDCRKFSIPLVILEIPHPGGRDESFKPSVPINLAVAFRANSEVFLSADETLGPYRGLVQTHQPHGNRHINSFSHLMLGIVAGEAIIKLQLPLAVVARHPAELGDARSR